LGRERDKLRPKKKIQKRQEEGYRGLDTDDKRTRQAFSVLNLFQGRLD
jgi:hypothetical protein